MLKWWIYKLKLLWADSLDYNTTTTTEKNYYLKIIKDISRFVLSSTFITYYNQIAYIY